MHKGRTSRKVLLCSLFVSLGLVILLYLGCVIYFSKHFFFHTEINGIDASCKSSSTVEEQIADEISTYSLTITGRNDITETITAADLGLSYSSNGDVEKRLQDQNPFLWITAAFSTDLHEITNCVTYDPERFTEVCEALAFMQKENTIAPKNAHIDYIEEEGYQIVKEKLGATVDKDAYLDAISNAIFNLDTELSLDAADCYVKPTITSDSQEMQDFYQKVTKYASTCITYEFGKHTETFDISQIKNCLKINNKKLKVSVKEEKVRKFVDKIGSTYNTYGKTRTFKASTGNKVSVSGGDYGWLLDRDAETKALTKLIKKGKTKTRKPSYIQKAARYAKKDWGNTYVEINLTAQHLWFYKNKKLVIDSDFVSGNVSKGYATPQGVYSLMYRERDAILGARSNADYRTPVDYWMPFNRGIGMHDATWRSKFGGTIYKNAGSHGCINLPHNVAETIFNNIETGTPVICYFDPAYE